jgi:hypothetical protein
MDLLVYIFWLVIGLGIVVITLMLMDQAYGQATIPQVQYAPIEVKPAGQNDYLAMLMPVVLGAATVILGKFAKDTSNKVNKVEATTQANAAAIVDSKAVEKELARLMFEWNKEKAEALDNSPETKLETLKDNIKKATDTAAQA